MAATRVLDCRVRPQTFVLLTAAVALLVFHLCFEDLLLPRRAHAQAPDRAAPTSIAKEVSAKQALSAAAPKKTAKRAADPTAPVPRDRAGAGGAVTSAGDDHAEAPAAPDDAHPGAAGVHGTVPPARTVEVDERSGLIRVDAPDGPIWMRQVQHALQGSGGEDPFPRCLICHGEIENVTQNMGFELDCTACHGGDPFATTKEEAHVHPSGEVVYDVTVPPLDLDLAYQQFVNPANLRVAHLTCGTCHPEQVGDVVKSMMATAAGHYAGGLYQNGVVDTKTPIYGTFAVSDDDGNVPTDRGAVESLLDLLVYEGGDPSQVATHFTAVPSQACARCHLWSRGKGYRGAMNADGVYRADGCAACHMVYANDGLSQSPDESIDHEQPGHPMHHVVTRQMPTEQCVHCHHRGARIGLSFTGRAQMPPGLPSGPGVPGTTDVRFNGSFHYTVADTNPRDVHDEAGMHCVDCHVRAEAMGDGNIYGHMDQATKVECQTCHGWSNAEPTLRDNDGNPLPNVAYEGSEVILTSKVTGARHEVRTAMAGVAANPNAACAMTATHVRPEGGLECYACHSSWIPNCYGCHFERDERELGLNLMTGEFEVGRALTNNKIFETVRPFSIGPNSSRRVAPYIIGCQAIADVTGPNGEKILDFVMPTTANGLSGLALNPVNPHTVRGVGEVRTCAECHRSPPSLGFGSGNYAVARTNVYAAGAAGLSVYDRDASPGLPVPQGALPGEGAARAVASLPNVIEGTADYLFVAHGADGVLVYDHRPDGPDEPVATITGVDAIDVARAARFLYVVDAGVGVRIYDNDDPEVATLVDTVPLPTAVRVVPWGIHLLVPLGPNGLGIVNVADHEMPFIEHVVSGLEAVAVRPYAHFRAGPAFAVRAYVADPSYGVRVVDLLPDYDGAEVVGGLPLPGAAGLDAYTRWVPAAEGEPSREHDYLYVAAGAAGLHVFDITDPDAIVPVAAVTDLGGAVVDVDVASQLAPPGVDDYAILANEALGLQVVGISDPLHPVVHGTVPKSTAASRVLVEVQQMDRYLDEQGRLLKENSHPGTGVLSRAEIVRILSASIACEPCVADIDGSGAVDADDLVAVLLGWGGDDPALDVDGSGVVDVDDLLAVIFAWGKCV